MTEINTTSAHHHKTIENIDSIIRVVHVGGQNGVGKTECLLQLGESLSLSIFEANIEGAIEGNKDISWKDYDIQTDDYAKRYGVKLSIIPLCISNCVGKKNFNINVEPACSSLLKISPNAKNYTRMAGSKYRIIWGEICQPTRTVEIDVTTLDELCDNGVIQTPHFLSLDVQGAEYDILEGASKALKGDLLGVISEVEFSELYDGQKLFTDQYTFLKKHQFRLFELYNSEYWYSGNILGEGALTVAEALFLRDFHYFIAKDKKPATLLSNLSKLAIIAYYFNRLSYAFEIVEYIMNNWQYEWNILIKKSNSKYLHDLVAFYHKVKALQPQMEKVPTNLQYKYRETAPLPRYKALIIKSPAYPFFKIIYQILLSTRNILNSVLSLAYNVNLKMIVGKLRRI